MMSPERFAAIKEQLSMAGRPTIAAEIERELLELRNTITDHADTIASQKEELDDLAGKIVDLTGQLLAAQAHLDKIANESAAAATTVPPVPTP